MPWRNTREKFGLLTRLLHWTIFILFVFQYFLVYRREYFPEGAPEKMQYILLHKSLGVVLIILAFTMLVWRHLGERPEIPAGRFSWERSFAKITHVLLYICMLFMPLSGISMSLYSGYGVKVFNWFSFPQLVSKNPDLAGVFHEVHEYLSYVIIVIVGIHIVGALYHKFIRKDEVLSRMTFGE